MRLVIAAACLALAAPAFAGDVPQSQVDALVQDARIYAAAYDVTLAEAMARLRAQEETVPVTDRIRAQYRNRLAGIAIEHRPAYRIVVLLTGPDPAADETVSAGGFTVPIVFRTGAAATRDQILAALTAHQAEIRAMTADPPGLGVDQRTGELVVALQSDEDADDLEKRIAALTGVPVRIDGANRSWGDMAVAGGMRVESRDKAAHRVYACTTGFVVTDGLATAIATAAHCPDMLTVDQADGGRPTLRFVGGWGARYQDVQINAGDMPLEPLFHPDPAAPDVRTVTGWRNRESSRAGDYVCHAGETTGYSCAEILYADYAPAGDLCYGPCPPTWVAVAGPACKGGDSGGPVFSGTTAFGILKGGSYRPDGGCNFYVYMSTDYLPPPWRVMYR